MPRGKKKMPVTMEPPLTPVAVPEEVNEVASLLSEFSGIEKEGELEGIIIVGVNKSGNVAVNWAGEPFTSNYLATLGAIEMAKEEFRAAFAFGEEVVET